MCVFVCVCVCVCKNRGATNWDRWYSLPCYLSFHSLSYSSTVRSYNTPSIIRRTGIKRHCLRVNRYAYDQFKRCKTSTSVNFINIMQKKMTQKYERLSPMSSIMHISEKLRCVSICHLLFLGFCHFTRLSLPLLPRN